MVRELGLGLWRPLTMPVGILPVGTVLVGTVPCTRDEQTCKKHRPLVFQSNLSYNDSTNEF